MSSMWRNTVVEWPSISSFERSAMASNTGCRFEGDEAITFEHVGGRGLPRQRLPGLVEKPRVLDRDHGLVGEGLQQPDVMVANVPGSTRVTLISPIGFRHREQGDK